MDTEQLRLTLWIVSGLLMLAGVLGVAVALILDRQAFPPVRAAPVAKAQDARVAAVREKALPKPVDERVLAARRAAYRQGLVVLVGLAVLTALEFWVATAAEGSTAFLFVLVLAKSGLILQYYMHLGRLGGEEGAHE